MWKRAVVIGALAAAVAATTALPSYAEQGKGRRTAAAAKNKSAQPAKRAKANKPAKARASKAKQAKIKAADPSQIDDEQRARLRRVLPAGMTIEQAASGFENHGAFISAVNASHTHRVSFVQLKHLIVNQRMTLGQALKSLRPDLDGRV